MTGDIAEGFVKFCMITGPMLASIAAGLGVCEHIEKIRTRSISAKLRRKRELAQAADAEAQERYFQAVYAERNASAQVQTVTVKGYIADKYNQQDILNIIGGGGNDN